jgi:hypothetical protein
VSAPAIAWASSRSGVLPGGTIRTGLVMAGSLLGQRLVLDQVVTVGRQARLGFTAVNPQRFNQR